MKVIQRLSRAAVFLFLACLSVIAPGLTPALEASAPAEQMSPEQQLKMLDSAMKSIKEGNPETAITRYLDPLIEQFERRVTPGGERLFSANSQVEALFYLALSAAVDEQEKTHRGSTVLNGTWSTALQGKGYALVDLERYDEAKAVLRHGIEIAPKNPMLWGELGAILQQEKNWPEALAAFNEAEAAAELVFDKDSKEVNLPLTRALRGQGYVLTETGKLDESEKRYKRCLELDPNDDGARQELTYIANLRKRQR